MLYHHGSMKQSASTESNKASTSYGNEVGQGLYLGLFFFTMSSVIWCCWRCWSSPLFALTQGQMSMSPAEGRTKVEGVLLSAQTWHPALGQMGHLTILYQSHWDTELEEPFSLQECGLLAAVTPVEMDDAAMKRLFRDECCHSSQMEFLQGRYTRLSIWGKYMSRGGDAFVRVRVELQGFALRE